MVFERVIDKAMKQTENNSGNEKKKLQRALSVSEILKMKKKLLNLTGTWQDAFGTPEFYGVWFIWGNSGNGKSTFVMQLCRELCKFGNILYVSLEEGTSLTLQNTLRRENMIEANGRLKIIRGESMDKLSERLSQRKSADFVIIDSFQYTQMTYKTYVAFKEKHPNKLLIFISQADGKNPSGRSAKSVMYDASLKIWVEGYRAFSKGRFFGSVGHYTIWEEGSRKYRGE